MKSILSLAVAATALLRASMVVAEPLSGAALEYRQYKTLVTEGCYSSSTGLTKNSSFIYNSKGYCQTQCVPMGMAVQATSNSDECWCGNELPPASSKVDDGKCNAACSGFGDEMCGADGYFSVYLTGTATSAPNADSDSSASTSATAASVTSAAAASSTLSAKPSVVTIGGQTIVVTAAPSSSTSGSSKSSGGGGTNKAAIAAGVVVGIVAIGAIAGGLFLFLRHRRRREVEEEYRRNAAVSNFVAGGKPTSSAGASSFTDTRLDPVMAQRRMSDGSIADNQDYSRRILKVTNA